MQARWIAVTGILIMGIYGCQAPGTKMAKIWFYVYDGSSGKNDTLLTPASFLNLQDDGHYTMDIGHFDFGRWEYSGDQLIMTSHSGQVARFTAHATGHDLQIMVNKERSWYFERAEHASTSEKTNPFSLVNNRWRIPANSKESGELVTSRLKNHFRFWETYFNWALQNEIQYIDVRSTPTPIKIYGNGFSLKTYGELPAKWKSCFYDEADCREASDKIRAIFEHGEIGWPQTTNKYKMFLSAFRQLETQIR